MPPGLFELFMLKTGQWPLESARREMSDEDESMVAAVKTGFAGVEIHGKTIRVYFMYKRVRYGHTLGIEPTRNNIKHAARLRAAALFALKTDKCNEADFFPNSRPAETADNSKRLSDLCERYKPLKAVDITPETQLRYEVALDDRHPDAG